MIGRVAVVTLVGLLTGCGFTAIKPQPRTLGPAVVSPLRELTVAVAGTEPTEVERATRILRDTSLFETVVVGLQPPADLTATVFSSGRGIHCGLPQMATTFSLGLVPTGNSYTDGIRLDFSTFPSGGSVLVEARSHAPTKHGLWALFLRGSKQWTKPDKEADPTRLADRLRDELLVHQDSLVRLARPAG
jgi:hypothetical protein